MTDLYILWGADQQSLTQVAPKLSQEQKIIHIAGQNFSLSDEINLEDADAVLWSADGDIREALEKLPNALAQHELVLARVIGVLDVEAYAGDRKLGDWVKMLSHFSDVMLLLNASQAPAAFVSELERRWKDRPMLIKRWPKAASETSEIFLPEARRLSQYFDDFEDDDNWEFYEGDEDTDEEPWAYEDKKKTSHSVHEVKLDEINEPRASETYFNRDSDGNYVMRVFLP